MYFHHQPDGRMESFHTRRAERMYRELLHNASQGLSFSQDVMWEMGADFIPYIKSDFTWLFRASGPLAPVTSPIRKKKAVMKALRCHTHPEAKVRDFTEALPAVQPRHHDSMATSSVSNQSRDKKIGLKRVSKVHSCFKECNAAGPEEWSKSNRSDSIVPNKLPIIRQCKCKRGLNLLLEDQCETHLESRKDFWELEPKSNTGLHKTSEKQPCQNSANIVSQDCKEEFSRTVTNKTHKHTDTTKPTCLQDCFNRHAEKPDTENKSEGPCSAMTNRGEGGTEMTRVSDHAEQGTSLPHQHTHYPKLQHYFLCYAVEEWRKTWKIKAPGRSVIVESLMKALADQHHYIRLEALVTLASLAVKRTQELLFPRKKDGRSWEALGELQSLLLSALHDPVEIVQIAAAVCHYAMSTPNICARDILHNAIQHDRTGAASDSLVAAQCLAVEGEASQTVIERLLSQYFLSKTPSAEKQAASLLASISSKTTLVRSLLAEELNCANWKTRVLACNIISQLKSPINKDLTSKLTHMMWKDWSGEVRQAAARTLGKLDIGSVLQEELRVKLQEGSTSQQLKALVLMDQLKIMTPRMLPAFLQCLTDDFMAVRKQACRTAASLMVKDEPILNQLVQLMRKDPSCDIRVLAINTLAKIGFLMPTIQESLLWVMHHEDEPKVTTAACEALEILGVKEPEMLNLQENVALRPSSQIQRHTERLMKSCMYNLESDLDTVRKITDQVQKLCTKSTITEKVLLLEELQQLQQQHKSLLGHGRKKGNSMPALLHKRFKGPETSASL